MSAISNTTDNSIKKPADGMDTIETSSLPEYGMRPIDRWRNNEEPVNSHTSSFDIPDLDQKVDEDTPVVTFLFLIRYSQSESFKGQDHFLNFKKIFTQCSWLIMFET